MEPFETFPFLRSSLPESRSPAVPRSPLEAIGEHYYQHRQSIMQTRQ